MNPFHISTAIALTPTLSRLALTKSLHYQSSLQLNCSLIWLMGRCTMRNIPIRLCLGPPLEVQGVPSGSNGLGIV